MWRYRELMPLFDGEEPVTLGEGFTPLVHARRLGATVGLDTLFVKDESLNPTNSFKARGQSAAVTRAKYLGATTLSVPSAGNAGNALAAYAACAGLHAKVFLPRDVKPPFERECVLYGADVTLVDGLITDAGRIAAERGAPLGWYDVSTLKEPYRIEGKKTMAYELAEQLGWSWPDWIIYPTGGGTGMVGMWKAFDELEQIGWMPKTKRPRMVSVQADGCAPIVRAFQSGTEKARDVGTRGNARGRLASAQGDWRLSDPQSDPRKRRHGGERFRSVDDRRDDRNRQRGRDQRSARGWRRARGHQAVSLRMERFEPEESVVLFNTGGALKYLDVLSHRTSRQATLPSASRSEFMGTVFTLPTTSASGFATMSGGSNATMVPNSPWRTRSTALPPKRVASTRSKLVGAPPRCKWPSTTDRVSLPVSVPSASATFAPMPPSRSTRPSWASSTSASFPPAGYAPSATTTMLKCAPQWSRSRSRSAMSGEIERNFRDQDRVGATGHTGIEGNPPSVTPHHFDHDDSSMGLGGRVQAIDRIGRKRHGRVETEAVRRADDVVVDGLGHADDGNAATAELVSDGERAVAADDDERAETHLVEHLDASIRVIPGAL